MKKIEEIREFNYEIEEIWTIISDISRSDWVPGVSKITLENDTRIFEMEGMGDLVERIISCDNSSYEFDIQRNQNCCSYRSPFSKN